MAYIFFLLTPKFRVLLSGYLLSSSEDTPTTPSLLVLLFKRDIDTGILCCVLRFVMTTTRILHPSPPTYTQV